MLFGDDGAAAALPEDALVVDMSTIAPTASRAIAERLRAGVDFVDAPVSGSQAEGRGRHADDLGRRRADGVRARPAAVRGDGRADRARRPARPRPDGEAAHQHVARGQRAPRWPRRCAPRKAAGLDLDALLEVAAGSAGAARDARPEGPARCSSTTSSRCCSSSSTCSRTSATRSPRRSALGIELQLPALAEGFYAGRPTPATARTTSPRSTTGVD